MTDPRKTAQRILAEAGQRPPRLPRIEIDDFAALARDYLSRTGEAGPNRLGDVGAIYVTMAAARKYGAAERIADDDLARRELTELLIDAKPDANRPEQWRARRRSTGLDITATVAQDGRLMIVTDVSVRAANVGGRRG